ncbi:MAG TPA: S8 family serine peptidase [Bryobacteraceae bacterium]|nr:S8 family serine peptidase [Bryobacteraceae bacterium]
MKVAVVDSGIHAGHSHVGGIAGGVAIVGDDVIDRVGHGTAVAAAIREKAPDAELYAVKIFDRKLATDVITLVRAIHWCAANGIQLINLSLGTTDLDNGPMLQLAVDEALADGTKIVSAYEHEGVRWLPGSLRGVIPVLLDWDCPREECRVDVLENGRQVYRASGYPRPIPGVPPEQNLKGISFAVANVTGCLSSMRMM